MRPIEIQLLKDSVPSFYIELGAPIFKKVKAIIDTGAPRTIFYSDGICSAEQNCFYVNLKHEQFLFPNQSILIKQNEILHDTLLIGMDILKNYCLFWDLTQQQLTLQSQSKPTKSSQHITYFRERPIIELEFWDEENRFVLDTGSSLNWLFLKGQTQKFFNKSILCSSTINAIAAFGKMDKIESRILQNLKIAAKDIINVPFALAKPEQFGGNDQTLEAGIIGTGTLASNGIQILDFINHQYSFLS